MTMSNGPGLFMKSRKNCVNGAPGKAFEHGKRHHGTQGHGTEAVSDIGINKLVAYPIAGSTHFGQAIQARGVPVLSVRKA